MAVKAASGDDRSGRSAWRRSVDRGAEMAERGRPLALRRLFIAARGGGRRRHKLRAERWWR
jgi:hypothetical protein